MSRTSTRFVFVVPWWLLPFALVFLTPFFVVWALYRLGVFSLRLLGWVVRWTLGNAETLAREVSR